MTTKTLRLSDSLAEAVRELGTAEHIDESTAMRKLLRMGYNVYVAEQYRARRISLRDVAARMKLPLSETLEACSTCASRGIPARTMRWRRSSRLGTCRAERF